MFIQLWGLLRANGKIILSVQKKLGFLFSLYLDKLKSSLMELSNKHKKLLDCQFKIEKPYAIISTWKKVISSVYDYSVFNWRIRPNTRSSKPKQMSKESSASWARGVWFTKVDRWIVWHTAWDSNPCCRREGWDFSGIRWYFQHF